MKCLTLGSIVTIFGCLAMAACEQGSPANPTGLNGLEAASSELLTQQRCPTPPCGGGSDGGGGGGNGTPSDFDVEMVNGGIRWDPSSQPMQAKRDNKKALAGEGLIMDLTMNFAPYVTESQCEWTDGLAWDDPSIQVLRQALGDPTLPTVYPQNRAVNFQINHNGNGTGTGAIRMLSVPEGEHPWLSYCFNTGQGLCDTLETSAGGVRTFTFSNSAVRAVLNGGLVCTVSGLGATMQVTPRD